MGYQQGAISLHVRGQITKQDNLAFRILNPWWPLCTPAKPTCVGAEASSNTPSTPPKARMESQLCLPLQPRIRNLRMLDLANPFKHLFYVTFIHLQHSYLNQ